jgi:GH24 family phage-related lysozyme (muramidase)
MSTPVTPESIKKTFPVAVSLVQAEEGFRAEPYKCSEGFWTIGYGYNLQAHGYTTADFTGWRWTRDHAEAVLLDEMVDVVSSLDARYPLWRERLSETREAVVISAVYQMGIAGASKFKDTIAAIRRQDWPGAAACMMRSKWASQDAERVKRNCEMLITDTMPTEVRGAKILRPSQPSPSDPSPVQDVDAAPAEPHAPAMPTPGPGDGQAPGEAVGQEMGTPVPEDVPAGPPTGLTSATSALSTAWDAAKLVLSRVGNVSALIGKSPASYGAGGMLAMLVGKVSIEGNIRIFDHTFYYQDGDILAALAALGLVLWGVAGKAIRAQIGEIKKENPHA